MSALQTHRYWLQAWQLHTQRHIRTVDATIAHMLGEVNMSEKKIFEGFTEEKTKRIRKASHREWGDGVKQSIKLWNSYGKDEQQRILAESGEIFKEIAQQMPHGPESDQAQAGIAKWHQHLRYFYERHSISCAGSGIRTTTIQTSTRLLRPSTRLCLRSCRRR